MVKIATNLGSGSGVIFETDPSDNSAFDLTNYHVIEGFLEVSVTVRDSITYTGQVIDIDSLRDLAVVRICCDSSFKALTFADAQSVAPGSEVIAMGYPLGIFTTATVTRGIVSTIEYLADTLRWVIHTDALINPGNSGGPLLTLAGEILGVNTFKIEFTQSGRPVEGFGFAISEQTISQILPDLKNQALVALPTPTPTPQPTGRFGPTDGVLEHDPAAGFIEVFSSGVFLKDSVIEARFFNPYSTSVGSWDYGFIFRDSALNTFHAVFVRSDGYWYHYLRMGTVEASQKVASQQPAAIDTSPTGSNYLQIVALGDEAWLFINGTLAGELNVGSLTEAGDVLAINAYFTGDSIEGESTRFEDFTVRSLEKSYGPTDGALVHDPDDGSIETHSGGISTVDAVIEVRFLNPYPTFEGAWDYGFMFRNFAFNTFHSVIIGSNGLWYHYVRTGTVESSEKLASQSSSQIDTSSNGSNHLRIIALGNDAWVFINDVFIAKLALGDLSAPGDVKAITGFFTGDEVAGKSTNFEDFTVWEPQ